MLIYFHPAPSSHSIKDLYPSYGVHLRYLYYEHSNILERLLYLQFCCSFWGRNKAAFDKWFITSQFKCGFMGQIRIRSDHNFAHARTSLLLWHVRNCGLRGPCKLKLEQTKLPEDFIFELMDCCVKWVLQQKKKEKKNETQYCGYQWLNNTISVGISSIRGNLDIKGLSNVASHYEMVQYNTVLHT